jgi:hypothetical protein
MIESHSPSPQRARPTSLAGRFGSHRRLASASQPANQGNSRWCMMPDRSGVSTRGAGGEPIDGCVRRSGATDRRRAIAWKRPFGRGSRLALAIVSRRGRSFMTVGSHCRMGVTSRRGSCDPQCMASARKAGSIAHLEVALIWGATALNGQCGERARTSAALHIVLPGSGLAGKPAVRKEAQEPWTTLRRDSRRMA